MGMMTLAPPEEHLASTRAPGIYGGNMDFNRLTPGMKWPQAEDAQLLWAWT
jgi:acetamidase/formamidase